MKYFGPKNALAKYLANATFSPEPKVALGKDPLYKCSFRKDFALMFTPDLVQFLQRIDTR